MPKGEKSLYEIGADIIAIDQFLLELGGDISDDDIKIQVDNSFTTNDENLKAKLLDYGKLIRNKEASAETKRAEVKRLEEQARLEENGAKLLKQRIQLFLEDHGIEQVKTDLFTFSLAGKVGKVILSVEPEELPEEFRRVKVEANKEAIAIALKDGKEVPGATMGADGKSLRLK